MRMNGRFVGLIREEISTRKIATGPYLFRVEGLLAEQSSKVLSLGDGPVRTKLIE
jgi:hypothetical protein